MLIRLLALKEPPEYLDSTDALGVAVCHFFQRTMENKGMNYSGWEQFVKKNPDRLTK
jgi:crossover junction endodeoxyribonuclease RuvC